MPSKRRLKSVTTRHTKSNLVNSAAAARHVIFFPLLTLCLVVWSIYRFRLGFPVWFDEIFGKAVFFGLPVWLYVTVTGTMAVPESFSLSKLRRGLLLGVAVGGLYGFSATIISFLIRGLEVQAAPYFMSDAFWWEFFLALMTAFWETLFFFAWVMTVVQEKYQLWSLAKQIGLVALIFVIFHVPNAIIRYSGTEVFVQLAVLFLFAIGQGFLYARRENSYALVLSHAIWGMVLLIHLSQ